MFLRHDFCFCCILKMFEGVPGGSLGGEGVCAGIDASWVTQNKSVCIWWQMFVIGRKKGCRDKFVLREALIVFCVVKRLLYECGTWERGVCGGIETGCVVDHEVVCMFEEGVLEGVWERCNCTRRS